MKTGKYRKSLKNYIDSNPLVRGLIILASLVLPVAVVLNFTDVLAMDTLNPIRILWIGFYSSILLAFFTGKKIPAWAKFLLLVPNILIILFLFYASLMGGWQGLTMITIKTLFPFIPEPWIWDGIDRLFGRAVPYQ